MTDFWQRLRQRKLVQWTLGYAAVAFALLQGVDIVAQRFGWPDAIERSVIIVACVGVFVVILLAWFHGERGAQKVSALELMVLALVFIVGGGLLWRFAKAPAAGVQTAADSTVAKPAPSATAPAPFQSIAVLPLVDESGEKDQQYFSDGLSEDLITALSQFAGLKVIGRNSSFQFRDTKVDSATIGTRLGVAHLLEGSVRRAGDEVRISAELINAADGSTLWSEHYDRPYKDLFKLQDEITQAVAMALQARLLSGGDAVAQSDRPPGGDLAAYTAYLKGKAFYDRSTEPDLKQAITFYSTAVRIDPRYALAYAGISQAWDELAGISPSGAPAQQAYAQARAAADKALSLDPQLAAAHVARGNLLFQADFDWAGAEAEYRQAVKLAPSDSSAMLYLATLSQAFGQTDQATTLLRQALATDPLNAAAYHGLAAHLTSMGRYDEAETAMHSALALQPTAVSFYTQLAVIETLRGHFDAALKAAQQEPPGPWHDVAMTMVLQIGPDKRAADAALKDLIAKDADSGAYQIAGVYALRRDPDAMFTWLDRAWAQRDSGITALLFDPFVSRYRDDPRFAALCRRMGLPMPRSAPATAASSH